MCVPELGRAWCISGVGGAGIWCVVRVGSGVIVDWVVLVLTWCCVSVGSVVGRATMLASGVGAISVKSFGLYVSAGSGFPEG